MFKKHFTVGEANELIPTLLTILHRIETVYEILDNHSKALTAIHEARGDNGGGKGGIELLAVTAEIAKQVQKIHDLGVLVKDPRLGLLDFPHLRDGREVFLCWEKGEKAVEFWHDLDAGYQGRQPL